MGICKSSVVTNRPEFKAWADRFRHNRWEERKGAGASNSESQQRDVTEPASHERPRQDSGFAYSFDRADPEHIADFADFGLHVDRNESRGLLTEFDDMGVSFLDQAHAFALAPLPSMIKHNQVVEPHFRLENNWNNLHRKQPPFRSKLGYEPMNFVSKFANDEFWYRKQVEYLQYAEKSYEKGFDHYWTDLGLKPEEGRLVDVLNGGLPDIVNQF